MRLFALYADVELINEPAWLKDFRIRYDTSFPYHVTLKQPCYIEDGQVENIKQTVASFLRDVPASSLSSVSLIFDHTVQDEADGSIMLVAEGGTPLATLQQALIHALDEYRNYYEPQALEWERNFRPHLTIARDLTPQLVRQAAAEIPENDMPKGRVASVTLVVARSIGDREPDLTHYRL